MQAKDYWRACVQVRQKCDYKKTLFHLEQLILKHDAATMVGVQNLALAIRSMVSGLKCQAGSNRYRFLLRQATGRSKTD